MVIHMSDEPVFLEKAFGVRYFRVDGDACISVIQEEVWSPGVNVAKCIAGHRQEAISPVTECSCGLYAYHGLTELYERPYHGEVIAIVNGWGNTELHANGWRSQYAQIVGLAPVSPASISPYRLQKLGEIYHVPTAPCIDELLPTAFAQATSYRASAPGWRPLPSVNDSRWQQWWTKTKYRTREAAKYVAMTILALLILIGAITLLLGMQRMWANNTPHQTRQQAAGFMRQQLVQLTHAQERIGKRTGYYSNSPQVLAKEDPALAKRLAKYHFNWYVARQRYSPISYDYVDGVQPLPLRLRQGQVYAYIQNIDDVYRKRLPRLPTTETKK